MARLRVRTQDILFFRVDRRRKMPVHDAAEAIGLTPEQILRTFFDFDTFFIGKKTIDFELVPERLRGEVARFDFATRPARSSSQGQADHRKAHP